MTEKPFPRVRFCIGVVNVFAFVRTNCFGCGLECKYFQCQVFTGAANMESNKNTE